MFNQYTGLFKTSLEPINKLVELNISTVNTVAHQQGQLIADLVDNSITFSQSISITTDITNFLAEQSKFSTGIQNQLSEALKQTSETLTKAQKDAKIIINESFSGTTVKASASSIDSQAMVPKILIKEKPAPRAKVKVALKAKAKAKAKAKVKAAPKAEVKAAPKAEVKVVPKAEVKAAPKAEVNAAPKAEIKAAPKAEMNPLPKE